MGQKKKLSDHPSHPIHPIRQYKLAGRLVPRGGRSDGLSTVRARLGTARARLGTARARLATVRARLVTARARLAGVGFQHSTCKTSRGGIFIKEILYKFFRPHETKGLSYLVFLPQNFRFFFFYKGNSL